MKTAVVSLSLDEQRQALRGHLQTQRRILISRFNPPPAVTASTPFPRSMTMRMLSGKSTMFMLMLAELLPVLLLRFITKSSHKSGN
jgi:hypothetical protein